MAEKCRPGGTCCPYVGMSCSRFSRLVERRSELASLPSSEPPVCRRETSRRPMKTASMSKARDILRLKDLRRLLALRDSLDKITNLMEKRDQLLGEARLIDEQVSRLLSGRSPRVARPLGRCARRSSGAREARSHPPRSRKRFWPGTRSGTTARSTTRCLSR